MHTTDIIIPKWHGDDFNMVFVFRIDWTQPVGKQLSFKVMSENLHNLADKKADPDYLK